MMYRYKLILYCFCLTILSTTTIAVEGTFEDAELVNEFITMSFSSSHPYDLRHTIPGEPDIDYPIYSAVPKTNFDCNGRHEGYYADIETRCQVFRICTNTDLVGRGFAFLCPNGTLFSQKNFVCDWYRNVDCSDSERFYSKNDNNRVGSTSEMMETVRQMMEHPMKTITIALNRGKPGAQQPFVTSNSGISTTRDPRIFGTTPVPLRNVPTQQVSTRRQPITLRQLENAAGFSQSSTQNPFNRGQNVFGTSFGGARPRTPQTASHTTPLPPLLRVPTLPRPSPPGNSRISLAGGASSLITESSVDKKEVYVSNLGELSTDPGANFDHQTARIIAEPTSSSISVQVTSESVPLSTNKMNFAQKVNAGLNGQQVVNRNEIIAPEYVKNILHKNVPIPEREIQPPSFEFASNINSLLDEVAYESELEGQNSMHVQLRTPSDGILEPTKRPFRFLSRGFSYDGSRQDGSYIYGPPTAPRGTLPRLQPSTSTQSYTTNSFSTTPLFTTSAPVTSTEAVHISESDQSTTESKTFFDSEVEITPRPSERASNELILKDSVVKLQSLPKESSDNATTKRSSIKFSFGVNLDMEPKEEPEMKPTIEIEEKVDNSLNDLPEEPEQGSKVHANKRAEKLLVAGFKQTILNNLSEKSAADDDDLEESSPIVPLYIRVSEIPLSTTPVTSSPSTTLSTSRAYLPIVSSTTPVPLNQTTQSIRRYTVNDGRRRHTTRLNAYVKRQNVARSVRRTTTSTTSTTTMPSTTVKLASNIRVTSTTTTPPASRKRPTVSRFSFGSRRTVANETVTAPRKKLAVRSSDKDVSDLTAVASTYNEAPKRDYNSIRQNTYKYTQPQRRRPSHKTNRTETTTARPTTTTSSTTTTEPPRRSSSLPTPTLAPFSHDALFSISTTSTTLAPLPATFLSFTDLTKAIIDDSILQTFRRKQDIGTGSTMSPPILRRQPDAPIRQQVPAFTTTTPRSQERPTAPTSQRASSVPLKDFIASKFGAHYSPSPPKVSSPRPIQTTPAPSNELIKTQKQPTSAPQYPNQQYNFHQDRAVGAIKAAPQVQLQPNILQQPQYVFQQQQVPQQQYFQLHPQQVLPTGDYNQYTQLSPTVQSIIYRPVQAVQLVQPINYRFQTQQAAPTRVPIHHQQYQRTNIQQSQQIHLRTIHEQQPVAQLQRHQQLQHVQPTPKHQSQIQIYPSQVAVAQMIPPQHPNAPPSTSIIPQLGSINVRLPTNANVGGLIPNTNLYDSRLNSESLGRAQKRIDQLDGDATVDVERERKSSYSGVTSYEVPLNSVGRLANDITHLLRRLRRL